MGNIEVGSGRMGFLELGCSSGRIDVGASSVGREKPGPL